MLTQIELTPARAEALEKLEQATGESKSALISKTLDHFIELHREYAELAAEVEQARAEIEAGQSFSSAEITASAMSAISKVKTRKAVR